MKTCIKCKVDKPLEDFSWKSKVRERLNSFCKDCQKKYAKEHYLKNKQYYVDKAERYDISYLDWFDQLKNKPCVDCGITYHPCVMDFDHLFDKKFQLSNARANKLSKNKILEEIKKCELVCSNCHRLRTHNRRQK